MTKETVVKRIAEKTMINKCVVDEIVNEFIGEIQSALIEGNKVSIKGFGVFSVVLRKKKIGRDINKGKSVVIPAHTEPVFKPGDTFRDKVYREV